MGAAFRFRSRRFAARRARNLRRAASAPMLRGAMWTVYLLRCGDGTLYAGITNDLPARLEAHRSGRGAKYTRGRGPLEVVHVERKRTKSSALRREHALKRMPRKEKLALCA